MCSLDVLTYLSYFPRPGGNRSPLKSSTCALHLDHFRSSPRARQATSIGTSSSFPHCELSRSCFPLTITPPAPCLQEARKVLFHEGSYRPPLTVTSSHCSSCPELAGSPHISVQGCLSTQGLFHIAPGCWVHYCPVGKSRASAKPGTQKADQWLPGTGEGE